MFVYGIKDKKTNQFISAKSKGGKFYTRLKDAINKKGEYEGYDIVRCGLVLIPNNQKIKGNLYCYKSIYSNRLFFLKKKEWSDMEYKTYLIVEDGVVG